MLPPQLRRNDAELAIIRAIVDGGNDSPVLMMNLNRYTPDAAFPEGALYRRYISGLESMLAAVGARILWRTPVLGQAVGTHHIDEILAVWYPSHQIFLDLGEAPGAAENYRLRGLCVADAVIHRCPGNSQPRGADDQPRRRD